MTLHDVLRARRKSFSIPHPTLDGCTLHYGCLEGPEHGVYHRGEVSIPVNQRVASIVMPDYWKSFVKQSTIHITPLSKHMFVTNRKGDGFDVEVYDGPELDSAPARFSYMVMGSRTDAEITAAA